jgi:hypothetical protein
MEVLAPFIGLLAWALFVAGVLPGPTPLKQRGASARNATVAAQQATREFFARAFTRLPRSPQAGIRDLTEWYRRQEPGVKASVTVVVVALGPLCGFAAAIFKMTAIKLGFAISYVVVALFTSVFLSEVIKPPRFRRVGVALAVLLFATGAYASWKFSIQADANAYASATPIPNATDNGELAYLDGELEVAHTAPNQGLNVIYLPTDFSVSNEIRQSFPSAYSNPIASSPTLFRLKLRNDGARPWVHYAIYVVVHYEMRSEFPVDRKRWDAIPHVDETLVLGNCRQDYSFCELPPISPNDQPRSIAIINMSGAYAAIEIPDTLTATVPGSNNPIQVNVALGGEVLLHGNARTIMLHPNREGQGTFIR